MKARMKALQMMTKEKPEGIDSMMMAKKKKGMADMFESVDSDEMESEEGEEMVDGKITMAVSPKEKKLIMMFREHTKGPAQSEPEEEMEY